MAEFQAAAAAGYKKGSRSWIGHPVVCQPLHKPEEVYHRRRERVRPASATEYSIANRRR